jgi:hypothetical protein
MTTAAMPAPPNTCAKVAPTTLATETRSEIFDSMSLLKKGGLQIRWRHW